MSFSKRERRKIESLRDEGFGGRKIAEAMGVSYPKVRHYLESQPDPGPDGLFKAYAWDLETTDLKADIGSLRVACFIDVATGRVMVRNINDYDGTLAERERKLAAWTQEKYSEADVLIGVNSLAFDKGFLRGVCERHELPLPPKRIHADLMLIARYGLKGRLQSVSMKNLLDYYRVPMKKDEPSKHEWRGSIEADPDAVERITHRCVEDVKATALLFGKMKRHWYEWRGQ